MVKVRPSTPEEEQEFGDIDVKEAIDAGEIREGDPEQLASLMLNGGEVVLSDQVREFMAAEGISEDEFIAMLLKEGNREQ